MINSFFSFAVFAVLFSGSVVAQSKKDQIQMLQARIDSLNILMENERKFFNINFEESLLEKRRLENQIDEKNRIILELKNENETKMNLIKHLNISIEDEIVKNTGLKNRVGFLEDSLKILSGFYLEFKLGIELSSLESRQYEREQNGLFDHQNSLPDIDLLWFEGGFYDYQIFVNFEESEIRSVEKSGSDRSAVYCFILEDGRIIVNINNLVVPDMRLSEVIMVSNGELCFYNSEGDYYDCAHFIRNKSTCDLNKYFR